MVVWGRACGCLLLLLFAGLLAGCTHCDLCDVVLDMLCGAYIASFWGKSQIVVTLMRLAKRLGELASYRGWIMRRDPLGGPGRLILRETMVR